MESTRRQRQRRLALICGETSRLTRVRVFPGLNLLRSVIPSPFVEEEDAFDGMKCASWKHLSFREELRLRDEVIKHRGFISSRLAGDLCEIRRRLPFRYHPGCCFRDRTEGLPLTARVKEAANSLQMTFSRGSSGVWLADEGRM